MLGSVMRKKKITEQFLRHSEFNRSLGLPLTIALDSCNYAALERGLHLCGGPIHHLQVLLSFSVHFRCSVDASERAHHIAASQKVARKLGFDRDLTENRKEEGRTQMLLRHAHIGVRR
ncbi:unnamed protein product [Heligmosomoides polygyrus]|uniref:Uncharacterized protein n=1 Tax=Heligmosomoides polygyrus TaxID=6339 RepID=A0A183GCQ3_HELPZ|nr:unnamed protein product [Heligmosomoides polygyrus]